MSIVINAVYASDFKVSDAMKREAKESIEQFRVDKKNQMIAKELVDYTRTNEWQEKQLELRQNLLQVIGGKAAANVDEPEIFNKRIVLFISQSIPKKVLRRYVQDLVKVGGVMVMQGAINGLKTLEPTLAWMQEILKKDSTCTGVKCEFYQAPILIDPILFEKHNITKVPALTVLDDDAFQSYCEQKVSQPETGDESVIYGDAALIGLVEALFRLNPDSELKSIIRKLEGRG